MSSELIAIGFSRTKPKGLSAPDQKWDKRLAQSRLLPLKNFVDCGFAASVDADNFVDRLETGHCYIHDVVSRSQHDVNRRNLIEDVLVDRDLCAFRLGVNADGPHACRAVAAVLSKQLVELAHGPDIFSIAQRPEHGRVLEILCGTEIGGNGLVEVSRFAH